MRPKLVSLAVGLITAIGLSAAPLTTAGAAPVGALTTSPADPASRTTSVTQVTSETSRSQVTSEVTSHNSSGAINQTIVQTSGTGGPTDEASDTTLIRYVTLVTGDRVRLAYDGDEAPRVGVTPAEGRQQMTFAVKRKGDEVSVVPSDAAPLVANGRVDPRLFQVTSLVEQGYDDASTDQLPLIAEQSPGSSDTLLGLVSIAPLKKNAGKLWASLTDTVGVTLNGSALEGLGDIVASAKLERLWLDGQVQAPRRAGTAPDPTAAAPLTRTSVPTNGKVRVALVDSGVDATHPDLRGAVVAQRDFTAPRERATDGMGHGTHVASAIVGDGAASNGRYRGLAAGTGTELVVAKVLDDNGTGAESDVIAGMEWAVAQGAKIVNMSLGRLERSDGTDPVSQAINRLSSRALFVAAVGNLGPEKMAITSPGAADHTLTVAAFDHTGKTTEFSSRGPRPGDFAAKPDIAALGVNRVGARAEGTTFGVALSDAYTVMSGTS
ncbi:MAG TPA: S8 family serine peptidase, partial [Actinopolymorphaceae bacterium]